MRKKSPYSNWAYVNLDYLRLGGWQMYYLKPRVEFYLPRPRPRPRPPRPPPLPHLLTGGSSGCHHHECIPQIIHDRHIHVLFHMRLSGYMV